jgi:hypothetical protein
MQRIILIGAQWLNRPSTIFFMMKHTVNKTLHNYSTWHCYWCSKFIHTAQWNERTTKHINILNSFISFCKNTISADARWQRHETLSMGWYTENFLKACFFC